MSEVSRALAVDPRTLIEHAELLGRHQASWSQLLGGQQPQVTGAIFGEGLSAQGQRIASALQRVHEQRVRQAEQLQEEARSAVRLAVEAEQADGESARKITRALG